MSLSISSDTSMVKIMKCLDNKSDRKTLHNLMKCSYKVKEVADENGFSKIPEAAVDIYFCAIENKPLNDYFKSEVSASVGPYVQDEQDEYADDEYEDDDDQEEWPNYIIFETFDNHSKSMEKVILYLQSKAKSTISLQIVGANMDEDMLEVFRKHANFIKTIAHLELTDVHLKWTTDQFLQFMKLFNNLESFSIESYLPATYRITDEILSLVKTAVWINCGLMKYHIPFPHITSSIFDFWIEKKTIESINFEGISTEIQLPSVRKMIELLRNKPKQWEPIHFGTLKYSSDFHQQLVLFQKKRGFKFSIEKLFRLYYVVITYENTGAEFEFEVLCPMEMSFFETMLDDLRRLRVACEPHQNGDLEIRRPFIIMFQEHVNNLELYYYQFTEGIIGTATVQGFRNDMMREINTLEEEILVIIEKLKAEGMESDNLAEH